MQKINRGRATNAGPITTIKLGMAVFGTHILINCTFNMKNAGVMNSESKIYSCLQRFSIFE